METVLWKQRCDGVFGILQFKKTWLSFFCYLLLFQRKTTENSAKHFARQKMTLPASNVRSRQAALARSLLKTIFPYAHRVWEQLGNIYTTVNSRSIKWTTASHCWRNELTFRMLVANENKFKQSTFVRKEFSIEHTEKAKSLFFAILSSQFLKQSIIKLRWHRCNKYFSTYFCTKVWRKVTNCESMRKNSEKLVQRWCPGRIFVWFYAPYWILASKNLKNTG